MKILQTSDTHWGITNPNTIRKMFRRVSAEDFDVVVHCGDYCGTTQGDKNVRSTLRVMREFIPDKPILSVLGNHDYWTKEASLTSFHKNYNNILKHFKEFNVHFLDEDGVWSHKHWQDIIIVGCTGWYAHSNPPTNDKNFLPLAVEGDTNAWMLKNAERLLEHNIFNADWAHEPEISTVVFVSHFPVVNTGPDYKGSFEQFSWSESIKQLMQANFHCKHFLCGHAHQLHSGPLRWESGSNYCVPKYQIIEVI